MDPRRKPVSVQAPLYMSKIMATHILIACYKTKSTVCFAQGRPQQAYGNIVQHKAGSHHIIAIPGTVCQYFKASMKG
jgi:hypothetical protein